MKPEIAKALAKLKGISEAQARELEYRRTGKTTALALRVINDAMMRPNTEIRVKDHFDSRKADQMLLERCAEMVDKLDLVGFHFNRTDRTLRFDPAELQAQHYGMPLT